MASGGIKVTDFETDDNSDWPKHLKHAYGDVGLVEWEGRRRTDGPNIKLVNRIKVATGNSIDTRKVPWCAFWIGTTLEESGMKSTKSGMARSYLKWGRQIELDDAKPGDVVVTWRGKHDDGVTGHVFYYLGRTPDGGILGLGGNQGDSVSVQAFATTKLLGVRRYRSVFESRTVRTVAAEGVNQGTQALINNTLPDPPSTATSVKKVIEAGEQIKGPLEQLAAFKPSIMFVLSALSIVLICLAIYYRIDDHKSGKNV